MTTPSKICSGATRLQYKERTPEQEREREKAMKCYEERLKRDPAARQEAKEAQQRFNKEKFSYYNDKSRYSR